MRKTAIALCFVLWFASPVRLSEFGADRKSFDLTVAAGGFDRREAVVSFAMPKELKGKHYGLRDQSGRPVPLQVDAGGRATFVLPELRAGATKSYRLEPLKPESASAVQGVELVREGNKLSIKAAGRQVLGYQAQGELPGDGVKPIFKRGG